MKGRSLEKRCHLDSKLKVHIGQNFQLLGNSIFSCSVSVHSGKKTKKNIAVLTILPRILLKQLVIFFSNFGVFFQTCLVSVHALNLFSQFANMIILFDASSFYSIKLD